MVKSMKNLASQRFFSECGVSRSTCNDSSFSESDFYLMLIRSLVEAKKRKLHVF